MSKLIIYQKERATQCRPSRITNSLILSNLVDATPELFIQEVSTTKEN